MPPRSEAEPVASANRPLAAPAQQKFTNLNKIFYPKDGVTKGDVIQYYDDVAS